MDIEIARYQFHSWARKGIATTIVEPDNLGTNSPTDPGRASINLPLLLNTEQRSKSFNMIGPGDIIGINRDMIVRTQPRNYITDFEPNYLAFIEFYDEDFLWRYTPAAPKLAASSPATTDKLRPWLFLLILKEDEFEKTNRKIPLPSIKITKPNVFPPAEETWLWAHVHSDINIPDNETNTLEDFIISLNKNVSTDPDQLYCRLMSPRQLVENTPYYAFLVPAFETGRQAGLGENEEKINTIPAQQTSWTAAGANGGELPVYFEWYFRTGADDDFESLIKKLVPVEMDARVGIRDMDCEQPGSLKAHAVNPNDRVSGTIPPILGLEGALKAEKAVSTVFPQTGDLFQTELQELINLPLEVIEADPESDPVISIPFYGAKHAKTSLDKDIHLDITKDTWLHELNRDPRTRTAAGFGTTAIQENQETFMRKAWSQVRTIIDANKQIKATVFNMNVALRFTQKTFQQLSSNVLIAVARPVLSRIMGSPTTLYQQIKESPTPAALFSGTFRKMSRKYAAKSGTDKKFTFDKLVDEVNEGKISPAPPKQTPGGVFTTKDVADKIAPVNIPPGLDWILKNRKLLAIFASLLFIILAVVTGVYIIFIPLLAATAAGYYYANKLAIDKNASEQFADPQKQVEAIAEIPPQPNFTLKLESDPIPVAPTAQPAATTPSSATTTSSTRTTNTTTNNTDSVEAKNYRAALTEMTKRVALKETPKPVIPLSLSNTREKIKEGINPRKTFPKRLNALIKFPAAVTMEEPEEILPVMAYPDIEDPMYKKLTDISDEAFVPNLKFIKNNTISVLFRNQPFIEAYMVGLNHEMGRELLWREYPTDERGSYFRQFWDVNGIIAPSSAGTVSAQDKDKFKDITQIHTWKESSEKLGDHNNRPGKTKDGDQLVLTIRGDLLKKYPDTLVFAQKAVPADPDDEEADDGKKILLDLTPQQFKDQVMFPIYRAEVQPDIKFFGFDLTDKRAKGEEPAPGEDSLGWFFVIMQAPGAPVFGMDSSFNPGGGNLTWDDLSWKSFDGDMPFIIKTKAPNISPDDQVTWGIDAASMAYILFQKPNMVAVHAGKLLAH